MYKNSLVFVDGSDEFKNIISFIEDNKNLFINNKITMVSIVNKIEHHAQWMLPNENLFDSEVEDLKEIQKREMSNLKNTFDNKISISSEIMVGETPDLLKNLFKDKKELDSIIIANGCKDTNYGPIINALVSNLEIATVPIVIIPNKI